VSDWPGRLIAAFAISISLLGAVLFVVLVTHAVMTRCQP
jgi:hypothetical protein